MTVDVIRDERLLLADRLRLLSAADWDRPSLAAGWTVHHVLAHLVTPFTVSAPAMALAVSRHRGIGRAMDATARRIAASTPPADLIEVLESHASSTFRPPGLPLGAPLADIVAHGADIRWALGDPRADWAAPTRLLPALQFLTSRRAAAGFVPPGRLRGISLVAEDQEWRHGDGPEVRGPSLAVLMAALGRPAAYAALSGIGVPILSTRR